jgi:peptide deformylase
MLLYMFAQMKQHLLRVAEGFHARILQHECDYLNGILFPHRLKSTKYFGFEDELKDII